MISVFDYTELHGFLSDIFAAAKNCEKGIGDQNEHFVFTNDSGEKLLPKIGVGEVQELSVKIKVFTLPIKQQSSGGFSSNPLGPLQPWRGFL